MVNEMTNGFCKFDCKLYQRGCAGNSDGYIKNCKEYDPEPPYYLISPQDLEIIYRGDSDSSLESYEETRKHPYNLQVELETVLDELSHRANDVSEMAELSCHDGYHTGMHETDVIRISYLEEEIDKFRKKVGE